MWATVSSSLPEGAGVPRLVADARRLAPAAAELAQQTERERQLPLELVQAMRDAQLTQMCLPAALGGPEAPPAQMAAALEALAAGDGSAAWCAMIASTSSLLGAYVPPAHAAEVFGAGSVVGGVFAPRGKAVRSGEVIAVTGRWSFGSGIAHSDWMMGGCLLAGPGGEPELRLALMPRASLRIHDTWSVSGLRGTGSHDFEVEGCSVPLDLAPCPAQGPLVHGPLYAFPLFGLLALGIGAVALGIARGALQELRELAVEKVPQGSRRALAMRPAAQAEYARAQGSLRAARSLLDEEAQAAFALAVAEGEISLQARASLRVAATHAVRTAADVATAMYELGGGSAIYESSPLQRRFRDAHVATQHIMVAAPTWELAGRALFGLEGDFSQL